jgi:single-strand selective monofunctional uracil DNA glycosylase
MTKSPRTGMLVPVTESTDTVSARIARASRAFSREAGRLGFDAPVSFVYNPLEYARVPHEAWLRGFAAGPARVVFLGMNPGPWGMAQTGVPFGDIPSVRDWLGIGGAVKQPRNAHVKHPVQGFSCGRREVSGTRFWGLMREHYGTPEAFAADAFVANYCPLMFLDGSGRNLTPDRLAPADRARLEALCDRLLLRVLTLLRPAWVVGIGAFALKRMRSLAEEMPGARPRTGLIPHPSPASPLANRGWAALARAALVEQGIWTP